MSGGTGEQETLWVEEILAYGEVEVEGGGEKQWEWGGMGWDGTGEGRGGEGYDKREIMRTTTIYHIKV